MGRHANADIRRAFQEFNDLDSPSKCLKVRCLHCGYTRAKNTTRQIEHLQECAAYLNSSEATGHVAAPPESVERPTETTSGMLNGTHPNPNLQIHRRGPNQKRKEPQLIPAPLRQPQPQQPSLTAHLLSTNHIQFSAATQQPFLSHAGCGTLSQPPLALWMGQDSHYTRGYIQFIGALIAKIRLPMAANNAHTQFHPMYRTMDLLISALNNIRREMSFFDITASKFGIHLSNDAPNFITRSYLDLFVGVSSPSASLLEGMVVLWATEHCNRSAWMYAQSFTSSLTGPSTESHIAALHQALIPNWTSPAFSKFVDACRGLVDELANSPTIANGMEEMQRCEQVFRQVCFLAERFWPEVDGMGEEDDSRLSISLVNANAQGSDNSGFGSVINGNGDNAPGSTT